MTQDSICSPLQVTVSFPKQQSYNVEGVTLSSACSRL